MTKWGAYYDKLIHILWNTARTYADEHDVHIHRLNPVGEHTKDFYYLWQISPGPSESDW
jgi:hypothetical protein